MYSEEELKLKRLNSQLGKKVMLKVANLGIVGKLSVWGCRPFLYRVNRHPVPFESNDIERVDIGRHGAVIYLKGKQK